MNRVVSTIGNTVLPLVVLAGGVLGARAIIAGREDPPRAETEHQGAVVAVEPAEVAMFEPRVHVYGVVKPWREVVIQPQVTGRVTWLADAVIEGGYVAEGEELFRLDARDFRLTVEAAEVAVDQAEASLAIERGMGEVAELEWDRFAEQLGGGDSDPSLALREPQARAAQAAVEAAENRLDQAQLQLSRTVVTAPFDAIVRAEQLEPGQLVSPSTPAVTLVGAERYRVEVQVPLAQLDLVHIPGVDGERGSPVVIRQAVGGREARFEGSVARLLPSVDGTSRMARLLIDVPEPTRRGEGGVPLLLDMWVQADIDVGVPHEAVRLPAEYVRNGEMVWVLTGDGTLDIRHLDILWTEDDVVWIEAGLDGGEYVITTHIETPVDGMALRRADALAAASETETAEGDGGGDE